jgi:long-chain acyl-CoA synthetase
MSNLAERAHAHEIWPAGVAREIDVSRYRSIADVVDEACGRYADLVAFDNLGQTLTYRDVDRLSKAFASFLVHDLGLAAGDRIAIQMPNVLQYPIAVFGALRAGLVVVNTNPLYTPREMKHQLRDSGARAILILENFADKLEEILGETDLRHVILTEIGDLFAAPKRQLVNFVVRRVKKMVPRHRLAHVRLRAALARGARHRFEPATLERDDLAFLQYTGGTTGVSKGAMLTHGNVLANLEQISQWLRPMLREREEVLITALPLYHIFSLTVNCLGLFKIGIRNVLITNPRDIPAFVKELARARPTVMTAVNTLLGALMNHPRFARLDFSTWKVTVAGAMALKTAVAERWREVTGSPALEGYGLTEASPVVCCNPLDGHAKIGTIGLPLPSTQVKVIDEHGDALPHGHEGELCVRGPQVMKGYWNQEEETRKVLPGDGWLRTGDMATIDIQGFVRIVDRKKDMILVSGFNVYPNEVEEIAAKHPKVLDCAAIGVPDEASGEAVKLFVVKRDPSLTADELREHCRKELTAYKVPRHVEFRDELPKTNVGKVLRRALKEG